MPQAAVEVGVELSHLGGGLPSSCLCGPHDVPIFIWKEIFRTTLVVFHEETYEHPSLCGPLRQDVVAFLGEQDGGGCHLPW